MTNITQIFWDVMRQATIRANSNSLVSRKCELKNCQNILTYDRNYKNVFCWNCLYKMALAKNNRQKAEWIAESYL